MVDTEKEERYLHMPLGETGDIVKVNQPYQTRKWELRPDEKDVGAYRCRLAISTYTDKKGEKTIYAWYAPQLPYPFGPQDYGGLPGLILELSHNKEGHTGYRATQLSIGGEKISELPKLEKVSATLTPEELSTMYGNKLSALKRGGG